VGIGVFLDVEVLLEVGRCLWLFFGDPMSAVRDDRVFDVVGDTPDHLADSGAEGALHVVTTEAEVPHGRLLQDLLPGSDAGQRRVDGHPTAHAFEGNMAPTARRPEG